MTQISGHHPGITREAKMPKALLKTPYIFLCMRYSNGILRQREKRILYLHATKDLDPMLAILSTQVILFPGYAPIALAKVTGTITLAEH